MVRSLATDPARRRSTTPKRPRAKVFFQSPPDPVEPGSPWTNAGSDVPGNEATLNDLRFWFYKKLGEHHAMIRELADNSNYMVEELKLARAELEARPTKDAVAAEIQKRLHAFGVHVVANHPGFTQVKEHVEQKCAESGMHVLNAAQARIDELKADLKGALI